MSYIGLSWRWRLSHVKCLFVPTSVFLLLILFLTGTFLGIPVQFQRTATVNVTEIARCISAPTFLVLHFPFSHFQSFTHIKYDRFT